MEQIRVSAEAETIASPTRVFALLKDGSTWTQWSMFRSYELERPGQADPLGVGSVRVFATRVSKTRYPMSLTREFLLVDLVNNLDQLPRSRKKFLNVWQSVPQRWTKSTYVAPCATMGVYKPRNSSNARCLGSGRLDC
jgi:Polyketide cyclase / dehydrase and lipid transport.